MASSSAIRHTAFGVIAIGAVLANLVLRVDWRLALLAGAAVVFFGELSPRFLPGGRPVAALPASAFDPLSRREVEVSRLASSGMTSPAIAKQLHRATRTIENHIDHIYTKLNINSRAELALWMRDHGLLEDRYQEKGTNVDGKLKDDRMYGDDRKPRDNGKPK
jgi:DNA-binding CsgD family transcriptional regulator